MVDISDCCLPDTINFHDNQFSYKLNNFNFRENFNTTCLYFLATLVFSSVKLVAAQWKNNIYTECNWNKNNGITKFILYRELAVKNNFWGQLLNTNTFHISGKVKGKIRMEVSDLLMGEENSVGMDNNTHAYLW